MRMMLSQAKTLSLFIIPRVKGSLKAFLPTGSQDSPIVGKPCDSDDKFCSARAYHCRNFDARQQSVYDGSVRTIAFAGA
jgi:hypothetical protein